MTGRLRSCKNVGVNGVLAGVVLVLAACIGSLGCGGRSTSERSESDTGATAGSGGGGSSLGGSTSAKNPATRSPAGALDIQLQTADAAVSDRRCPSGFQRYRIGKPQPNGTIADGVMRTTVWCRVTAEGDLSTYLDGVDTDTLTELTFSISAPTIDRYGGSPANVAVNMDATGPLEVSPGNPLCAIDAVSIVKDGAILAQFSCPLLASPDDPSSGCAVQGKFAFEYCATE